MLKRIWNGWLRYFSIIYKDDDRDNVNIENKRDYSQAMKYIKDRSNILEIEIQEKINQSTKQMKLIMMISINEKWSYFW